MVSIIDSGHRGASVPVEARHCRVVRSSGTTSCCGCLMGSGSGHEDVGGASAGKALPFLLAAAHCRRSKNSAAIAATPTPAVNQMADSPQAVRAAPKIKGAPACKMRAGAFSQPSRRP